MKLFLLLCFAFLFVVSVTSVHLEPDSAPETDDTGFSFGHIDEDDAEDDFDDDHIDNDDDNDSDDHDEDEDEDDDDDDFPTRKPMQTHQCMKKFWLCKKQVTDCAGELKCYEEKSKCFEVYKAKQPKKRPSKAKSICKNTFNVCIKNAPDLCNAKRLCYTRKQKCYMRLKPYGRGPHRGSHHRHHHRRRPHHRHHRRRPTPCPKMMKCMKEFRKCIIGAHNCSEKLTCMWRKHECMERARPTEIPTSMKPEEGDIPAWKRKWNPKIVAKCKMGLEKCINKSTTCSQKTECFLDMKICFMTHRRPHQRRFPMPSPQMLKCKLKWRYCTRKASNCSEKLACMWRKHECMRDARKAEPPTSDENVPESRRRWNPKIMEKCLKEFKNCINESTTCQQKMKCFWGIKKCIMSNRGGQRPYAVVVKKIKDIFGKIPGRLTSLFKNVHQKINVHRQGMRKMLSRVNQRRNKMTNQWKKGHWNNWKGRMQQMRQRLQQKIQQKIQANRRKWQQRRDWFKNRNHRNHQG